MANLCPTLCDPTDYSMPGFPGLHYLQQFAQIHVHWVRDPIQASHPLSLSSPPTFNLFPASGSFPMSQLFRWPKYWSFSFSISPSDEYSRLISFRMDWLDLLEVQGNLKSLLHTTVWKHQFLGAQPSLWSSPHIHLCFLIWSLHLSQLFFQEAIVF